MQFIINPIRTFQSFSYPRIIQNTRKAKSILGFLNNILIFLRAADLSHHFKSTGNCLIFYYPYPQTPAGKDRKLGKLLNIFHHIDSILFHHPAQAFHDFLKTRILCLIAKSDQTRIHLDKLRYIFLQPSPVLPGYFPQNLLPSLKFTIFIALKGICQQEVIIPAPRFIGFFAGKIRLLGESSCQIGNRQFF